VPNYVDGTLTKLRASDGKVLGTFNKGGSAIAAASDGRDVWVTNNEQNTVSRLAESCKTLATYRVGPQPIGVAFDGANIWVANSSDGTVTKLRASDGKALGTFRAPGSPDGVAFDGTHIWVTTGITLWEFRASDGKTLAGRGAS
jgi:DNA-binding beta-propeller fold protein YncE